MFGPGNHTPVQGWGQHIGILSRGEHQESDRNGDELLPLSTETILADISLDRRMRIQNKPSG